jgi:transcriptional regulator of acetoin/glycerol metabolism
MQSLASLFGITASAVFDHFRAPLPAPMMLHAVSGQLFHVSARFNGPQRGVVLDMPVTSVEARMPGEAGARATHAARQPCPLSNPSFSGLHYLDTGDAQIAATLQKVRRVINRDIPLLIMGETGTGKELLARAVHQDSNRARQPFVAVNCASIPESLIEAELFGYEEGAFTGARRKGAVGRIVQAHGGTLFLDEIGDMPLSLQARLLRVLQERNVTPLGSLKSIPVDIAVIGATHRNLREMIGAGTFREDLYYRLNGLVVRLPALRDRSDLDVVARRILLAECPQETPEIDPSVLALFKAYAWPGNLRQLANVLRTAAVMGAGEGHICEHHLSDDFLEDVRPVRPYASPATAAQAPAPIPPQATTLSEPATAAAAPEHPMLPSRDAEPVPAAQPEAPRTLGEAEIDMIRSALAAADGNISVASKRLGISRNTIYRKLRWNKGE